MQGLKMIHMVSGRMATAQKQCMRPMTDNSIAKELIVENTKACLCI